MKILLLIVVGSVLYVLYKIKKSNDHHKHLPGVSLLETFKSAKDLPGRTAKFTREKLAKIALPGTTMVLATHPDSAKFMLSDTEHFPKMTFNVYRSAFKLWDHNVAFTNDTEWRQYRNVLSPPFHFDAVRKWVPDFHKLVLELLQNWEKISDKPVDITLWMPRFTLDVLGVTVLSRNFNALNGAESEDIEALNTILSGKTTEPKIILLGKLEKLLGINLVKDLNNATDMLYKSMLDIINARKAAKTKESHFDLIDVMLSAHNPSWDERELVSNAFIMFTAGHETTATALGWLMYYLALNQDVQRKVKQEVDAVLKGQPITQDNLKELTYLSNVIKENLRIQPPAGYVPTRIAIEDIEFEGKIIPKGSRVGVNIWAIHHDPEIWTNPMEFNPDRFDKPVLPFSYLPFSLKSRACLGNQFSLVEQTVFVATLLQRFKLDSVAEVKLPPTVEGINKLQELKLNISKW